MTNPEPPARSSLPNMIITTLVIALGFYLAFMALIYLKQDGLLYLPDIPGRAVQAKPTDIGLTYEDIALVAEDNIALQGWFVPAEKPAGTLLFFHGNAGNIGHRLDSIAIFHRLQLNVLIIDYRGYGQSAGEPTEDGTYLDARAAWDYLIEVRKISPQEIVIFGRSLGGAIAAWLATQVRPAGLIIESGFTSVPDRAAELYPLLPVRLLSRYQYPTRQRLQEVTAPVLIIHSPQDEVVPFTHGQALYAAAAEPKMFLELSGGHNDGFLRGDGRYRQGLQQFLQLIASVSP